MSVHHPYYMVDASLLPPAGVKRTLNGPPSSSLTARQERLSKWHVEQQQKSLVKLGLASVSRAQTPRDYSAGSHGAAADSRAATPRGRPGQGTTLGRKDPRLRGHPNSVPPPGLDALIDGLRRRLEEQGPSAQVALEKVFQEVDVSKAGVLTTPQFREVLVRLGLVQKGGECDLIFAYFDDDRSGSIDFNEFLDALRGQLNDVRRAVVRQAFASLDINGDGVLSVEDLRLKFRNSTHPDIANSRDEDHVYAEFLSCFDVISRDGQVTLAEFERYYEYLSSLIASDEFFVTTVRSAWHLPGAPGGPCLRVGIKRAVNIAVRDPRAYRGPRDPVQRGFSSGIGQIIQEVVEIRPDLSVSRHDPAFFKAVHKRLKEMGYHDVEEIEVLGRD